MYFVHIRLFFSEVIHTNGGRDRQTEAGWDTLVLILNPFQEKNKCLNFGIDIT